MTLQRSIGYASNDLPEFSLSYNQGQYFQSPSLSHSMASNHSSTRSASILDLPPAPSSFYNPPPHPEFSPSLSSTKSIEHKSATSLDVLQQSSFLSPPHVSHTSPLREHENFKPIDEPLKQNEQRSSNSENDFKEDSSNFPKDEERAKDYSTLPTFYISPQTSFDTFASISPTVLVKSFDRKEMRFPFISENPSQKEGYDNIIIHEAKLVPPQTDALREKRFREKESTDQREKVKEKQHDTLTFDKSQSDDESDNYYEGRSKNSKGAMLRQRRDPAKRSRKRIERRKRIAELRRRRKEREEAENRSRELEELRKKRVEEHRRRLTQKKRKPQPSTNQNRGNNRRRRRNTVSSVSESEDEDESSSETGTTRRKRGYDETSDDEFDECESNTEEEDDNDNDNDSSQSEFGYSTKSGKYRLRHGARDDDDDAYSSQRRRGRGGRRNRDSLLSRTTASSLRSSEASVYSRSSSTRNTKNTRNTRDRHELSRTCPPAPPPPWLRPSSSGLIREVDVSAPVPRVDPVALFHAHCQDWKKKPFAMSKATKTRPAQFVLCRRPESAVRPFRPVQTVEQQQKMKGRPRSAVPDYEIPTLKRRDRLIWECRKLNHIKT
ncbi:uncharacterized protein MONOS_7230 [Monocercomonoides exilis]|uniref:uncharacterized protein n=1 Tax=Monocercomonoides exilis TaxID=2049356 RepID=UPI003559A0F5|nr:hypothetical protein MONOS_7230 [Monocercomonoides exilis]|eukprot:MONOS_7230.1-p1 / transcript=MONOS_7230.1 / gene=MONOS_7230 / organism=Monocercomonoides_exilis_PA203 / gene_product=unspecified product / transcript_product=unspecified product / location=Mono_scaffold00242:19945-21913(-) / protein_length=608 / sequence_SO=supercontig / SO=protein_coding / is_pseudo=false